ncbi:SLATT domain-containing protein [Brevibacterium aurantiacum]|uniref:SLATT domain-containing protein n=1 Tax=Brevibacterium aurantiacum TaxID=273384 RepID=UPI000DE592FD|nr:SLATT domain-containing protein [Brevibacterium aurantiacum]
MSEHNSGSHDESRGRPGIPTSQELLERLQRRVEITRKARHETARRVEVRGKRWDTALVLMALTTSVIAIVSLIESSIYAGKGDLISAVLGIVVLAVSLLVTNANYAAKSTELFRHYQSLQKVSTRIEQNLTNDRVGHISFYLIDEINREYLHELSTAFNHSTADLYLSLTVKDRERMGVSRRKYWWIIGLSEGISSIPQLLSIVSIIGMTPFAFWMLYG